MGGEEQGRGGRWVGSADASQAGGSLAGESRSGKFQGKQTAFAWGVIALCALVAIFPLLRHGASCGQDSPFHLQSWFAAASAWHGGTLYPHWVADANYGAGEPRFVFYPPLSWVLGALLGLVLPWASVPAAFTFVVLFGCGGAFHRLARAWLSPAPALLAAVLHCNCLVCPATSPALTLSRDVAAKCWLSLCSFVLTLYSAFHSQNPLCCGVIQIQAGSCASPLHAASGVQCLPIRQVLNLLLLSLHLLPDWVSYETCYLECQPAGL